MTTPQLSLRAPQPGFVDLFTPKLVTVFREGYGLKDLQADAAAGPPICTRLPPRSETRKPPTMAVYSPRSGVTPEPMAIAMDSGRATMATVRPATASA